MTVMRVLVFGATGCGKTSLCNILTGRERPTDSGALGVTAKSHVYGKFSHADRDIELVDTVGLHESSSGTVPSEKAVLQLTELLRHSRDGFSLLVHVAKAGRLTQQQEEDYRFFVETMTRQSIPTILVLTCCENEQPMQAWLERNGMYFARFSYRDMLATCFASGGRLETQFAPLREQSRQAVLSSIVQHALPEPARLFGEGTDTTLAEFFGRLWNEFVDLAGLPAKYRAKTNETAYQLLRRLGVPRKVADLAVKHLPDLLGEIASKTPVPGAGHFVRALARKVLEKLLQTSRQ